MIQILLLVGYSDIMNLPKLNNPELYINRELSMLEFNRRVIEQANDETVPLLERLKFLSDSSTNLKNQGVRELE